MRLRGDKKKMLDWRIVWTMRFWTLIWGNYKYRKQRGKWIFDIVREGRKREEIKGYDFPKVYMNEVINPKRSVIGRKSQGEINDIYQ